MSERSDFDKFLKSLGAKEVALGKKHLCWQIGSRKFYVPSNLSGQRAYRNYEVAARRIAAEEGLISSPSTRAVSSDRSHDKQHRPQTSSPGYLRVPHGTRRDLEKWNRGENERWRSLLEGGKLEMDPKRRIIREAERLPIVEQILRAVNKPLTAMEIAKIGVSDWDWKNADVASHAILRLFKTHPKLFRATRGMKRSERWELVPPEPPAAPQVPILETLAPSTEGSASAAIVVLEDGTDALKEKVSRLSTTIELVRSIIAEFEHRGMEPSSALYTMGRVAEAVRKS